MAVHFTFCADILSLDGWRFFSLKASYLVPWILSAIWVIALIQKHLPFIPPKRVMHTHRQLPLTHTKKLTHNKMFCAPHCYYGAMHHDVRKISIMSKSLKASHTDSLNAFDTFSSTIIDCLSLSVPAGSLTQLGHNKNTHTFTPYLMSS